MNLEKAKEIMTISENEKASLDRYQGFLHAALNTLIEIDPSDYEKINQYYTKLVKKCLQVNLHRPSEIKVQQKNVIILNANIEASMFCL